MSTSRWPVLAYGLMGLPLAMVALPVYVQVPQYYSEVLGLPLATTGLVLFAARIIDTVQDPWLGRYSDSLLRKGALGTMLVLASIGLALLFAALWLAPVRHPALLAGWLALALAGIYTLHSFLNITYLAWGARLSQQPRCLMRASALREAFGLAGVVIASTLPISLVEQESDPQQAMAWYALMFAGLLGLGLVTWLRFAPRVIRASAVAHENSWRQIVTQPGLLRLLIPYFLNSFSVAVPATLALFFINDHLGASSLAGVFLGSYFVAGAATLPLWTRYAARQGPVAAWRAGMLLATAGFVGAGFLETGDTVLYWIICMMAGAALGADLAMPPVILARLIPQSHDPAAYYGLWSLLGKCALAFSGLTLPVLALFGYQPGNDLSDTSALVMMYAALPCVCKLLAWFSLRRFSLSTVSS